MALPKVRQKGRWCAIVILLTMAIAAFGAANPASAQDEDERVWALGSGTSTLSQPAGSHHYRCIEQVDSPSTTTLDGTTFSIVGLCSRRETVEGNNNDKIRFYVLWDSALPSDATIRSFTHLYRGSGAQSFDALDWDSLVSTGTWVNQPLNRTMGGSGRTFAAVFPTAVSGYYFEASQAAGGAKLDFYGYTLTFVLATAALVNGTPSPPEELRVTPNEDYTTRELNWEYPVAAILKDAEVHRQELLSTETGSNLWGNDAYFTKQEGVDPIEYSFADSVNAPTTYRYRVRSVGFGDGQSVWSTFHLSNELPRDKPSAVPAIMYPRPDQERFTLSDDGSPKGYQFEIIGEEAAWPVQLAIQGDAFRLSATSQSVTDCTAMDDELTIDQDAREFWLYTCELGNATLLLRSGVDGKLYSDYPLFTADVVVPPREPQPPGELFRDRSSEDHLGVTQALEALFETTAFNVNPVLAKDFLVLLLAVGIGSIPILRGGRLDVPSVTTGYVLASLVFWAATMVVGYPVWWAVIPAALLMAVGVFFFASRLRSVR